MIKKFACVVFIVLMASAAGCKDSSKPTVSQPDVSRMNVEPAQAESVSGGGGGDDATSTANESAGFNQNPQ